MSLLDRMINDLGVYKGDGIESRPEVHLVKSALCSQGIPIDSYIDKIVEVDGNPRPPGFKFVNKDVAGLRALVQMKQKDFFKDDAFNSLKSSGESYRQGGLGAKLHIEIGPITDCHIDSHQIVVGDTPYGVLIDFNSIWEHASWDLGPEIPLVGYLYFPYRGIEFGPYVKVTAPTNAEDGYSVTAGYGGRW